MRRRKFIKSVAIGTAVTTEWRYAGLSLLGQSPIGLLPALTNEDIFAYIQNIYTDAKKCIWREWDEAFVNQLPNVVRIRTRSIDRNDYILHSVTGEQLSDNSRDTLLMLRPEISNSFDCLVVVSEGLNVLGVMDDGSVWSVADQVDHNITKVVSGIATTALKPEQTALECVKLIG